MFNKLSYALFNINKRIIGDNVISSLIAILVGLLPVVFYLQTYDSTRVKYMLLQIGITCLFALFSIKYMNRRCELIRIIKSNKWLCILILLYLAWGGISLALTPFKTFALRALIHRVLCLVLFVIALVEVETPEKAGKIFGSFIIGVIAVCLYGLVQFLGFDPLWWRGAFGNRVFSSAANPSLLASFIILSLPLYFLDFSLFRKHSVRYVVVALSLFIMAVTYSRNGYVGVGFEMALFVYLAVRYGLFEIALRRFIIILSIVVMFSAGIGVMYLLPREKGIDCYAYDIPTWKAAVVMIKNHLVSGVGIGGFEAGFPLYRDHNTIKMCSTTSNSSANHPHNSYLNILAEEGVIGFGLYVALVLSIFMRLFSYLTPSAEKKNAAYIVVLISAMGGYMMQDMFWENSKFTFTYIYFWLFGGIALGLSGAGIRDRQMKDKEIPATAGMKLFQISILLIVVIASRYFVNGFLSEYYLKKAIDNSKKGEWNIAIINYDKALSLDRGNIVAHYLMGNTYCDRNQKGDIEKAMDKYRDTKKLAPNYVLVNHQLGRLRGVRGEYQEAIVFLKQSLVTNSVYPQTYAMLAECYRRLGNDKEGEAIINKVERK